MAKKRQSFSKDFKAKVTLEALREESTIQEIAVKYSVHPNQISQWKAVYIEGFQGFDFSAGTLRNFGKNMSSSVQRKT